jgi:hypothetical protein
MEATESDGEVGDAVKESEKVLFGDDHGAELAPAERVDPSGMSAPWDSSGRSRKQQSSTRSRISRIFLGCQLQLQQRRKGQRSS